MDFRLMGSKKTVRCVLLTAALTVVATAAAAQSPTDGRGRVFGFVGGSFGEGGAGPVTGGGVGLRVTRHLGLDLEVRHTIGLDLSNDDFVVQDPRSLALFAPFSLTRDAGLTTFMTRMTVEFPAAGGRLFPYVTGGGGVGSLSERIGFGCSAICPALSSQFIAIGLRPSILPFPETERRETGLALTVGGGLDVRLWRGLAIGAEASWMRLLLNQRELDVAQIAARVSYRF